MNRRSEEMDNFLKFFGQIYKENSDFDIYSDSFYHELCKYDYGDVDLEDKNLKDYFERWIDRYKNVECINVFHTEHQNRFLQFQNAKDYHGKEYKLYLSFPKDKIFDCVNRVFDYIAKNDMATFSKVADFVRSDSVVLRMKNKKDVARLVNFINNDAMLVNSARKTNPFLMREGIIGYGYDDCLSYNSILCDLFKEYFDKRRNDGDLDNVSLSDFYSFAGQFYNDVFVKADKFCEFYKKYDIDDCYKAVNHKQVFEIILMSLSDNCNFRDYFSFVEDARDRNKNNAFASKYNDFLKHDYADNAQYEKAKSILDGYITLAISKYGADEITPRIIRYTEGDPLVITREGNFRDLFMNEIRPDDVLEITNNNIYDYVSSFINKDNNKKFDDSNYVKFCNACKSTLEKYNYKQLYCAVVNGASGEFKFFSNGNNEKYRHFLRENVSGDDVYNYCIKYLSDSGYELDKDQDLYIVFCDLLEEEMLARNKDRIRGNIKK